MKIFKKGLALLLSVLFVAGCFSGCSSSSDSADEITSDTLLIAYTEENYPFIYTDDSGNLTGLDVEIFNEIFNDIKDEEENYAFILVDEDYELGEDVAYTDSEGNECVAYIMAGGVQKDNDSIDKDYSFTADIVDNRIITVTTSSSTVTDYANFDGAKVGIVTSQAKTAFEEHSSIMDVCKSTTDYDDIETALADLDAGTIDAVVTDEFSFNVLDSKDNYTVLDSELETISYVYAVEKWNGYADSINEAIYELKDPDYNDADGFTPLVEKYFGYDANAFDYEPSND
ncbi:MAG: transporter substrate-binding domain-containing protein [Clostridiales bacterium]|nr:transporter substrate-binding domain-containing protein [Clostridiales bacterium]